MELVQLTPNTYYIKNRTNIGVIKRGESDVFLVDTGNDADAGKKILRIISEHNWRICGIINTHSHADHIGGNKAIIDKTKAPVYANSMEDCFISYPILEPAMLYGAYPFKDLQNKFLLAPQTAYAPLELSDLSILPLPGHAPAMIGIKTRDDVVFLGDALASEEIISKYHIFYLYNVSDYLNTLDYLEQITARVFVMAHGEVLDNITSLIALNREKIGEICDVILTYLQEDLSMEELISVVLSHYDISVDINQYILLTSTLKAYISYLIDEEKIKYYFANNKIYLKISN